ncbi:MAG: glutamate--tRNA ligase [Candidatus Neomarinimicrobiota bacterium]
MAAAPRVRFAPSPTGELHLGGARTALFNYLFARQSGGKFYLRIEDTDVKRSKRQYVDQMFDGLKWLNLDWDGPAVFQSGRSEFHLDTVQKLLTEGNAYRCFCTVEELKKEREKAARSGEGYGYSGKCRNLTVEKIQLRLNRADPFCFRIRIPEGEVAFHDRIYGLITVSNREIDDFIIQRTDGTPTYNMTVVVDDSDMKITHVVRGDDHLTNTPKQIVIYQLLGRSTPEFAHLPMILGPDKRRLSKRHGALGVHEFRKMGYLPNALLNYLALLGWNPDTEQEVFEPSELMETFRLEQIQKKAAVYDEKKLKWMNGQHMAGRSAADLWERIQDMAPEWRANVDKDYLLNVLDVQKKRLKTLLEIMENSDFFFVDPSVYDEKTARKRWKDRSTSELITSYAERLTQLEEWDQETLESELRQLAAERGVKSSSLIHAARLAMTGVPKGPSLFLLMEMLGSETCIRRLETALRKLPSSSHPRQEEPSAG